MLCLGLFLTALIQIWSTVAEELPLHSIDLNLLSTWKKTPFKLNVIESFSLENEDLYLPLLTKLLGIEIFHDSEMGDYEVTMNEEFEISDQDFYEYALSLVESKVQRSIIDLNLANKYSSPRIVAHYEHYKEVTESSKSCPSGTPSWILQGDYTYCKTDDVFALKTVTNHLPNEEILLPFDRVIGSSGDLFILYGDYESPEFKTLFLNLYQFALSDKLSFVWRYIANESETGKDILGGYGIDLTLKRTDYIVIDDRGFTTEQQAKLSFAAQENYSDNTSTNSNDVFSSYKSDIPTVSKEDVGTLDFKIVRLVQELSGTVSDQWYFLKNLIQDFPKFASYVASGYMDESDDYSDLIESSLNSYKSGIENGLYVNGALIPENKLNIFEVTKHLKRETYFAEMLNDYGLPIFDAKDLIFNFTSHILEATKDLTNSMWRYNFDKHSKAITFFNDLEVDPQYRSFRRAIDMYSVPTQPGSIPAVSENIHEAIFAINLADRTQLYYFLTVTNAILGNRIPQRIGLVPLVETEEDRIITDQFLFLTKKKGTMDALRYLFAVNDILHSHEVTISDLQQVPIPESFDTKKAYKPIERFKKSFSLGVKPYLIVNGVFIEIVGQWQYAMSNQLMNDINYLYTEYAAGHIDQKVTFRDYLRKDSSTQRAPLLVPEDVEGMRDAYKSLPSKNDLTQFYSIPAIATHIVDCDGEACDPLKSITIVGHFSAKNFRDQAIQALRYVKSKVTNSLKFRFIDLDESDEFQTFKELLASDFDAAIALLKSDLTVSPTTSSSLIGVLKDVFTLPKIDESTLFLVFNGRYIDIEKTNVISSEMLSVLVDYETRLRLKYLQESLPRAGLEADLKTFGDKFDWFDTLSSSITKTFFFDSGDFDVSSVYPRYNTETLDDTGLLRVISNPDAIINVALVIDPMSEAAQKIIGIASIFEDMPFVSMNVYLRPLMDQEKLPIGRLYRGVYPSRPTFHEYGGYSDDNIKALFENVPETTLFTLDVDVPSSWIVTIEEATTDLDNVKLDISGSVKASYGLKNILVQGHARDLASETIAPAGVALELEDHFGNPYSDTNVMSNLGYFQLRAYPGVWKLCIKPETESSELYYLASVSSEFGSLTDIKPLEKSNEYEFAILDLSGAYLFPVFHKNSGYEEMSLIDADGSNGDSNGIISKVSGWFKRITSKKSNHADINIFTVASGHLYERFLGIMTASVMRHTKHTVKFWLIENYMSPKLKKHLTHLAKKYNFEYELITYKWPTWLRDQREKQRTIWGYKILFLDVLFPQDLDKVIFVDSDQIVRTDLKELVDLDLEGAPYGYTPMCDSREEMEGFRFWKQGYWKSLLGDDYRYHISALYVIDLKKFRRMAAGDKLRQHYQALSRDPNSLSNLDQDLPNNLQHLIKIHSLPQEWLWCETWCDDESLKKAKTIDLCNNPLTKEPKLDRARRQIPEWSQYDTEISELLENADNAVHSQNLPHDEL
ncbi:glycosyltransferase family 24 protein [[Candida] arabinofermentans NRRL YB-2248]|uniref:Glycosyltransferase family 24 protein n=1 Tax=[Candida] arabinofermentans NRRL YB-2248 TaxID=983967 RepID=A0A1E4SW70_9ASCO|nr:glycosyltransferase family 24 protein [[Candida] arabinofermentans NRRL YB-2248]